MRNSGRQRDPRGFLYSNGSYSTIADPLGTNGTIASGINDAQLRREWSPWPEFGWIAANLRDFSKG
jgi:hypothetical protein